MHYAIMAYEGWRERILSAVESDPRSGQTISRAAGLGPNFISDLKNADKDPRLGSVVKLCAELKISLSYVLLGAEMTPEDEELFLIIREKGATERLLALLRPEDHTTD